MTQENNQPCEILLGDYTGGVEPLLAAVAEVGADGAVLELGGVPDEELYDLVEPLTANRPELAEKNRRSRSVFRLGSFSLGVGPAFLPIEGDNLEQLRALMAREGDLGVVQLRIRDEHGCLLNAHDTVDGELRISKRLPAETVNALRHILKGHLQAPRRKLD